MDCKLLLPTDVGPHLPGGFNEKLACRNDCGDYVNLYRLLPLESIPRMLAMNGTMTEVLMQFWSDEQGQDLIEYTLLLAVLTLSAAGLMSKAGQSAKVIWTSSNSTLTNAAAIAVS